MQKYKIKLMPGDHLSSYGITLAQYEEIGNRFIDDGCPRNEFPMSENAGGFRDEDFFGWSAHWGGFYHACESAFSGRFLSYEEIMEKETGADWFERGELPPVGAECVVVWGAVSEEEKDLHELFHGKEVLIVAHDSPFSGSGEKTAVFRLGKEYMNSPYYSLVSGCFRPIKSDREKAIEKALEHLPFGESPNEIAINCLGSLYDAGILNISAQKSPDDFKDNLISLMKDCGVDFRPASRDKDAKWEEDFSYFFCNGDDLLFCDAELADELYEIERRENGAKS